MAAGQSGNANGIIQGQGSEIVDAVIVGPGRVDSEMLASSKGRVITVDCSKAIGEKVSLKITRDKHNIFFGTISKK